jgi:hypothetical protein
MNTLFLLLIEMMSPVQQPPCKYVYTLVKNKIKLSSYTYKEIQSGAVVTSYMTNDLLIYGEIFAHFLTYEDPSSYMTLQLLHSEFPYI